MPVPDGVSLTDAAGLPEVYCTVWTNMMDRCALQAGETVLIQGGTSGIGCAAIQIARAHGATVFATARNDEKCAAMRTLGAHHPINYKDTDFAEACRAATDGRGVDVVIDIIGGDYLPKEVELLAHGGRLMIINLRGGKLAEVDFGHVHARHLTITGRASQAAFHCREIRDLPGARGESMAAVCRRHHFAGNICRPSLCRGRRGASPDGIEPAYRQDHPDRIGRGPVRAPAGEPATPRRHDMDQILSDLASRCSALLNDAPGPEGRKAVADLLSGILADPAKVDALVPVSTGERELLYQDPDQGFCILAHVYDSPKISSPHDHGPSRAIYAQARGQTEMTDFEIVSEAAPDAPGTVRATRTYQLRPGDAHVYNEGDLHAPRRDGPTALIRIEGTDMTKVKRLRYEAV